MTPSPPLKRLLLTHILKFSHPLSQTSHSPSSTPGQRRQFSTSARRNNTSHPAIPDKGTWSLTSILPSPSSTSAEELTDEQLDKLHRLSALIPPPVGSEERAKLKRELAVMLRLVKGVHSHPLRAGKEGKGELVDARPLVRHDPRWNVSLRDEEEVKVEKEEEEGTKVLETDKLLGKVREGRKYQRYFVVDRT